MVNDGMLDMKYINQRLDTLSADVRDVKVSMGKMADAVSQLAVLEIKHQETRESLGRAFSKIESNEQRIRALEQSMPVLNLSSKWVFMAVISLIGLLATITTTMLIK